MRAENDGVGIEYEVTGEGRPVVLLHGFPDSRRLWRHQVHALADAGYKVIVPDQRGYGGSDKPSEVDRYNMFFNHLRATALSFDASAALITSVLKEM